MFKNDIWSHVSLLICFQYYTQYSEGICWYNMRALVKCILDISACCILWIIHKKKQKYPFFMIQTTKFNCILIQMCLQLSSIKCLYLFFFVRLRRRIGEFLVLRKNLHNLQSNLIIQPYTHHHCMFRIQTALDYAIETIRKKEEKQLDERQNSWRIWNTNRKWFAFTLYKSWFSLSLTSDTTLCALSCYFYLFLFPWEVISLAHKTYITDNNMIVYMNVKCTIITTKIICKLMKNCN